MATPPEQHRLDPETSVELLSSEFLPAAPSQFADFPDARFPEKLTDYIRESVLDALPNDLTRMIYLASLRDCNSGMYLHPELSHQRGMHAADKALRTCHEQVFRRLLTTRLPEYVTQLHEYIRYTRSEIMTVLTTWRSLQAYRATVPVRALAASSELYFLNIGIALDVLGKEISEPG
jgi:hypothetical protein